MSQIRVILNTAVQASEIRTYPWNEWPYGYWTVDPKGLIRSSGIPSRKQHNSGQGNKQTQRVGAACAAWRVSEFALNCRIQDHSQQISGKMPGQGRVRNRGQSKHEFTPSRREFVPDN
jgi:hypothetical protein